LETNFPQNGTRMDIRLKPRLGVGLGLGLVLVLGLGIVNREGGIRNLICSILVKIESRSMLASNTKVSIQYRFMGCMRL
jgi:hypothetical protein